MKLRTTRLGVAFACMVGIVAVAGWRLTLAIESLNASSGEGAPSEAKASDGAADLLLPEAGGESPATFRIRSATTPAEVREVLRITKQATAADRPALLDAALHAQDPLVAGNAIKALGRLKCFTSDPALLALTRDPRQRVRQDAVKACGLDGSPDAVPSLESALADGDASVRPLVLDALGKIGGPGARAILLRVAEDPLATTTDRVFARAALKTATPASRVVRTRS